MISKHGYHLGETRVFDKISVKWGKEKFTDVELNTDEPPVVFKAQLFALSSVAPERQKVMVKGAVIKDDDWGKVKIKDGMTLLMMGTAEELPPEPAEKVVFMEDMTDQQLASAMELPSGLNNLGNTCYMNATLQCLRSVPELKEALKLYSGGMALHGSAAQPDKAITSAIKDLFQNMDTTASAIPPIIMLNVLHMCYPQFAEKGEQGGFQQQDANECWTELVRCLQKQVPALPPPEATPGTSLTGGAASSRGFIDQYVAGEYAITMKCIEAEDEPATHQTETFYQLSCFIEKDVKYLQSGLKSRLEEHITKNSPSLGRDAQYSKKCLINRLPAYLPIQMVRFFYKEKEAVNAKILKDIKFPLMLDVFDLCTESLQQKLLPAREKFKVEEDKKLEKASKLKGAAKGKGEGAAAVKVAVETKKGNVTKEPFSFPDDQGSNNSGFYELQAVLTHKGRSSSSGHYVAWTRRKDDEWVMFDDDEVTGITSEDVLRLSGGGDWHCAYVLLYAPRVLEIEEDDEEEKKEAAEAKQDTPMETESTS